MIFFNHLYDYIPILLSVDVVSRYRPQRSCGKVMFLHLSVSHSVHKGGGSVQGVSAWGSLSRGGLSLGGLCPGLRRETPRTVTSGWYAYWNAFLFLCIFPFIVQFWGISVKQLFVVIILGIGYAIIVVLLLVNTYYNVLIAYALFYLFASITSELPWGKCDNKWNTDYCIATKYGLFSCIMRIFG